MTGVPMTELSKDELSAKLSELERLAYLERALGLARGIAIEVEEELIIARPDETAVTSGLRRRRDRLRHRLAKLREEIIEAATSGEGLMVKGEIRARGIRIGDQSADRDDVWLTVEDLRPGDIVDIFPLGWSPGDMPEYAERKVVRGDNGDLRFLTDEGMQAPIYPDDQIRLVRRPSLELPTEPGSIIRVLEYDGVLLWPGDDWITAPFDAELVEIEGDEPGDDCTLAWITRLPGRGFWDSPHVSAEHIVDFAELGLAPKRESKWVAR